MFPLVIIYWLLRLFSPRTQRALAVGEVSNDLTKYGEGLVVGAKGWTLPNEKIGRMGGFDDFVAIEFDNGIKLDVLLDSFKPSN